MKEIRIILILALSILGFNSFACKCPPSKSLEEKRIKEMENSYAIISAEVISKTYDENQDIEKFVIIITEVFKGSLTIGEKITIHGSIYCGPSLDLGLNLIYLSGSSAQLNVKSCGLSRSITNPENHILFQTPPPPPPMETSDSALTEFKKNIPDTSFEDHKSAIKELKIELEILRGL